MAQGHGSSIRPGSPFQGREMKKPVQTVMQPIAPRPVTGSARLELKQHQPDSATASHAQAEKGSAQEPSPPLFPALSRADHQLSGDIWQLTRTSLEAQEARLHLDWSRRGWVAPSSKPSAAPSPPQWALRTRNVNDLVAWGVETLESYPRGEQAKFRYLRQVEHLTQEAAKQDAVADPSKRRSSAKRGPEHMD